MKTIKQIADEIGVSRQAIHKRIRQEPLSTRLTGMLSTVDNRLTVSVDGETLIKQAFEQNSVNQCCQPVDKSSTSPVNQVDTSSNGVDSKVIELLQKNIEVLQAQLEIKDKQIDALTTVVNTQAESINADRKNVLAGTLIAGQNKLAESEIPKKKVWQFWKKWKGDE